jgi:hypothetical protein
VKPPKYPRLTPLKAFALLRELDEKRHNLLGNSAIYIVDRVRDALADHVRAALVKAGPR